MGEKVCTNSFGEHVPEPEMGLKLVALALTLECERGWRECDPATRIPSWQSLDDIILF